jgi:hypothetical protein
MAEREAPILPPTSESGERKPKQPARRDKAEKQPSPMLSLVSNVVMFPYETEESTFCPNYQFTGYVTGLIADHLCTNYRVIRDHPDFHPALLHIYVGTMWIVQNLKVMDYMRTLNFRDRNLLTDVLRDLDSMKIPGPLVDLFKGLSCGAPEHAEGFGFIGPRLPNQMYTAQGANDVPVDALMHVLPPVQLLRQNMNRFATRLTANGPNFDRATDNIACYIADDADPTPFDPQNSNGWVSQGRLAPGLCFPLAFPGRAQGAAYVHNHITFPPYPLENGLKVNSVRAYLGFDSHRWFMALYDKIKWINELFEGSTSLSNIPVHGVSPGQAICVRDKVYANDDDLRTEGGDCQSFTFFLSTPQRDLSKTTTELSGISMVNATFPANVGMADRVSEIGQPGSRLAGQFWNRVPELATSNQINPTIGINTVIERMLRARR